MGRAMIGSLLFLSTLCLSLPSSPLSFLSLLPTSATSSPPSVESLTPLCFDKWIRKADVARHYPLPKSHPSHGRQVVMNDLTNPKIRFDSFSRYNFSSFPISGVILIWWIMTYQIWILCFLTSLCVFYFYVMVLGCLVAIMDAWTNKI